MKCLAVIVENTNVITRDSLKPIKVIKGTNTPCAKYVEKNSIAIFLKINTSLLVKINYYEIFTLNAKKVPMKTTAQKHSAKSDLFPK